MQTIGDILREKEILCDWNGYVRLWFPRCLDQWHDGLPRHSKSFIDAGEEDKMVTIYPNAMRSVRDWDTGGLIDVPVSNREPAE